jgi:hypothetical protein
VKVKFGVKEKPNVLGNRVIGDPFRGPVFGGQNRNLLPDGRFLLSPEEQMRRFHEFIMLLGWICVPSHVTH